MEVELLEEIISAYFCLCLDNISVTVTNVFNSGCKQNHVKIVDVQRISALISGALEFFLKINEQTERNCQKIGEDLHENELFPHLCIY